MRVSASVSGGGKMMASEAFAHFLKSAQDALLDTVKEVAGVIESKGRGDISAAGKFGGSWTDQFIAEVSGDSGEVKLDVTMGHAYWQVFQYGATIHGKPLLYFKPTAAVGGLTGKSLPSLISKHSVTIPKKFHLIEISQAEAAKVPLLFRQKLKAAKD